MSKKKAGRLSKEHVQELPPGIKLLRTSKVHMGAITGIAFDPAGQTVASASHDGTIKLWETSSGKLLRTLEGHKNYVSNVAFDPAGQTVASASHDGTIKLWETSSGKLLRTLEGHEHAVLGIAFDPTGVRLASSGYDKTINLWNAISGRLLRTLKGHNNSVGGITFDPTGRTLISGSGDSTVRVWEVAGGKLLHTLVGHDGSVYCVAVDPSGWMLASGGIDKAVRIWEASSGRLLHTLQGHTNRIDAVAFSFDGQLLASKSSDGSLRLWSCKTWEAVAAMRTTTNPDHWLPCLAFHPTLPLLVTSEPVSPEQARPWRIHFLTLDFDVLLGFTSHAETNEADREEQVARNELGRFAYEQARSHLQTCMKLDPGRAERLQGEFGFLLTSPADATMESTARLRWCTDVWRVLSERNSFVLPELKSDESVGDEADSVSKKSTSGAARAAIVSPDTMGGGMTPGDKGEQLEAAVARLFRSFFRLGDDEPWKIRKQKQGTQGGFDLSIEWSGKYESAAEGRARCHIECKNYKDAITPAEVAEKLLSEPRRNPVIDHWILISPRSDPSNELNRFLEQQGEEETFPFQVQVWCPETGVDELFGLEPEVYDIFFTTREGEDHPRTWDQARREEVRMRWRARLTPPLRLPRGWNKYLREPALLCIHKEVPDKIEKSYENHVPMGCRNSVGVLMEKPLERYVDDWLAATDKGVLFLLGEFGDGKSFFTYAYTRRLIARWLADRGGGWLPLRLALSKYPGNPREFLRQRLEEFGADVGGWNELRKTSRRLIMLDGFDEISVKLDPETITENIKALLDCYKEFEGCKILITSRTHFFQHKKDVERLRDRLGQPPIYYLAPIPRHDVLGHLAQAIPGMTGQQVLQRVQSMNDPIGLASKPLFLEMLKEILNEPNLPPDLDVVTLYERYIVQSLTRKLELLDDPQLQTRPQETIANLRNVLGEIAEDLQRTGQGYASLSKFQTAEREPFAELLWRLSSEDGIEQDARSRVGARSLLARVLRPELEEEWPVDFCHRSMREYFVSARLCNAVQKGEDVGARFLKEVPLNHEILGFAVERWRKNGPPVTDKLLALIRQSGRAQSPGRLGGYALTLLYHLDPRLPREFDWTGKIFDGADLEEADLSGMNFRQSSFQHANLANVNFEDSNFEQCDLTGVRIEETAHVIAIGAELGGEDLIAAYRDNLLRRWSIKLGGRATTCVMGSFPLEPSSAIGVHESGQPWMRVGREWLFFDLQEDRTWKLSTRFVIKDSIDEPRPWGDMLTLIENDANDSLRLSLIDVGKQIKLASVSAKAARHCAAIRAEVILWSDANSGVRVRSLGRQVALREVILPLVEPSCLDILSAHDGRHLIAVGTNEGRVVVWELDLRAERWIPRKLLDLTAHDGPVTSVAFQHATKLASGGSDRTIALMTWDRTDYAAGVIERHLVLKLRCRGMKIKGLQTMTERAQLANLIEESSAERYNSGSSAKL